MKQQTDPVAWLLVLLGTLATLAPRGSEAVPPSPRLIDTPEATTKGVSALQGAGARYEDAVAAGVDRVYKEFVLDLSSAPQGATAHRNILVVLCDFDADIFGPARHPGAASTAAYYDQLFFSDDPGDGITSLREYYRDNSNGRLIVSGRVTSDWLVMPHSYAYYTDGQSGLAFASYPRSAQKLAEDAMTAAYSAFGNDLSFFDNDGWDGIPHSGDDDGYVDAVCVVHPGVGAEVVAYSIYGEYLWSHEAGIPTYSECSPGAPNAGCLPGMILGDVRGFLYLLVPEYYDFAGDRAVGTYFSQFGNTLGLPGLYGWSVAGLGLYSLMAYGSYLPIDPGQGPLASHPANLDAWSRQFIGFENPDVPAGPGSRTMTPASEGGGSLKVWTNGQPGSEYFLMEARSKTGEDLFLPGAGLLIYHVDDTKIDNVLGPPFRVAVVQADGLDQLGTPSGNYGDAGDCFPGSTNKQVWNESSLPNSRDYAGMDTQIRMTDIAQSGTAVSFHLTVSTAPALQLASYRVGDGDNGFADAGEQDSLFLSVRNVGLGSGAVSYTLSTADPYVTIVTGTSSSEAVSTGEIVNLSTPFIADMGSPPSLPHVVALTLAWNDGSSSGTVPFAVSMGMRAGLAESFESGAVGWSHMPLAPSEVDEWHVSSSRVHGGAASMKLGSSNALEVGSNEVQTYAPRGDAVLVSPMFQLNPGSVLKFYSWIDAETNGGTGAWDGGRVELALNGGPWRPLDVVGGYGHVIEYNSEAALRGEDAFSGSPQSWRAVVVDLSPYQGAAQIRFRFASDGANLPIDSFARQLRYYEGWYVDDVAVSPKLAVSVDLDPDVINLKSPAPWVTAFIEPSGFDVAAIDLSTIRLAGSVPTAPKFAVMGDHNRNGVPDLTVKFSREALDPLLTTGANDLTITGSLTTGEQFEGQGEVRVINPPNVPISASVAPNPLNPMGVLRFQTSMPGPVKAAIFDVQGRRVRLLMDQPLLPAGPHELAFNGRGERGEVLATGVYFYRVETALGSVTGRIAIVK